jgi:hypothetical protein
VGRHTQGGAAVASRGRRQGCGGADAGGVSSTPPQAEEQFVGFVKESVGFIVALTASIPLLADYFDVIALPVFNDKVNEKLLPLIATLSSSIIFLCFFWARDHLNSICHLLAGAVIFFFGIAALSYQQIYLHPSLTTVTKEIEAIFYLLGFTVMVMGIALVFIYGFVRYQERWGTLQQMLPRLDRDQWETLRREAQLQTQINDALALPSIQQKAQKPLKSSLNLLYQQYVSTLSQASWGRLNHIRGPVMDDVMQLFLQGVDGCFHALSKNDLMFWTSLESEKYLDLNKQLLKKGQTPDKELNIERIFLLSSNYLNDVHKAEHWPK